MNLAEIFALFCTSLIMALAFEAFLDDADLDLPDLGFNIDLSAFTETLQNVVNLVRKPSGRKYGSLDSKQRKVKDLDKHLQLQERKMTQAESGKHVPWVMTHNRGPHLCVIKKIDHLQKRVTFLVLEPVPGAMCECVHPVFTFTSAKTPICICAGCGELAAFQAVTKVLTASGMKNRGAKACIPTEAPAPYVLGEQLIQFVNNSF